MKKLSICRNKTFIFGIFLCFFGCKSESSQEFINTMLKDPLYLAYDDAFSKNIRFITTNREHFEQIGDILMKCKLGNTNVCQTLESNCISKNEFVLGYLGIECRIYSLRNEFKKKYKLSDEEFMDLRKVSIQKKSFSPYDLK